MKPPANTTNRGRLSFGLCPACLGNATLLGFALAFPGIGAESGTASKPFVATNYVLVTNIVIVTNYVVTTNLVLSTNGVAAAPANSSLPPLSWIPPSDQFDWLQLKSGEWLKGQIKALQERRLEFDSEQMELQSFDWKDIRQLRSPRVNDLLYGDRQKAAGPIWITPDEVTVGGDQPRTFPRRQLQSITPGGIKERNYWSGKVSAGLSLRRGNTTAVDYNAQASLQRRTTDTRLRLDYLGNVSRVDNYESANSQRINVEFDYWLSRRLYVITPLVEYYKDPFQNLDHRLTLGAGLGYDLIDRPGLEWNISSGLAYQRTWFDSVLPGDPPAGGAAALVFGSRLEWEISKRVDLILEYRGQYTRREVGATLHHSVSTLEVELSKRLSLDVSLVWDRTQNPQQIGSGAMPKQDDFRLNLGLGVSF